MNLREFHLLFDVDLYMAAVLHDTLEDTDATEDQLRDRFGLEVFSLVEEVSDDKSLPKEERKRLQIEHVTKCSYKAKIIKLADKIDNLTDLVSNTPEGWDVARIQDYFAWAREVTSRIRGTNLTFDEELDRLMNGTFTWEGDGKKYPCLEKPWVPT
jgi:guanosine-3',5'-bis(diphosphate) 3'-pyrophosphohydrolase